MSCAGGRPKPKSFKRTMRVEADVGGAESHEAAPAAAEEVVADNVQQQPPPMAWGIDSHAPAIPATHPAKKSGKGRAGSGGAKPLLQ